MTTTKNAQRKVLTPLTRVSKIRALAKSGGTAGEREAAQAALEDAGLLSTAESSIDQSNAWLRDDDVPF